MWNPPFSRRNDIFLLLDLLSWWFLTLFYQGRLPWNLPFGRFFLFTFSKLRGHANPSLDRTAFRQKWQWRSTLFNEKKDNRLLGLCHQQSMAKSWVLLWRMAPHYAELSNWATVGKQSRIAVDNTAAQSFWGKDEFAVADILERSARTRGILAASQMPIPTGTTGFPSLQAMNISTHHQVSNEK